MNQPNDNHEHPTSVDQLPDRLLDRALTEIVGGDTPPDLSARILAADFTTQPPPVDAATRRPFYISRWTWFAVAASLLVSVSGMLLWQATSWRTAMYNAPRGPAELSENPNAHLPVLAKRGEAESEDASQRTEKLISDAQARTDDEIEKLLANREKSIELPADAPPQLLAELGMDQRRAPLASDRHGYGMPSQGSASADFDSSVDIISSTVQTDSWTRGGREWHKTDSGATRLFVASGRQGGEQEAQVEELADHGTDVQFDVEQWQQLAQRRTKFGNVDLGTGPGLSGDQYTRIQENPFVKAIGGDAVSTFSIDVDTASYANVRQFLIDMHRLPPPDAVRIEELVNYFDYDYAAPNSDDETPFAAHVEVAGCPWAADHRLVRIGIKGREIDQDQRPPSNLVFLVDVSGSMDEPNKLPLVVYGLQQLTRELGENDRVAIVVYASSEGLVLSSTPGAKQREILDALGRLQAGGSTAGGAGIELAYQLAEDHFIPGGTNRVVLCTDGDFNVGVTSTAELERLVEKKAADTGVFLSVLGFGRGNLNDAMMEAISNRGNGNYSYVDNRTEARRVLVEQMSATLVTIAKDVKIQVEFNPAQVAGYRLLGYENRMLRTEDFNDDKKDAGEIGAGHTVTALYEIVPAGKPVAVGPVDDLKYQPTQNAAATVDDETEVSDFSRELLMLKMRYKEPDGDTSRKLEWPVTDDGQAFAAASTDFQFAAAVAGFGLLLRDSQYKGTATYGAMLEIATSSLGSDPHGYRKEFLDLVRTADQRRAGR